METFLLVLGLLSILVGAVCIFISLYSYKIEKYTIFDAEMRNNSYDKTPSMLQKPFHLKDKTKLTLMIRENVDVTSLRPYITEYFSGNNESGRKWMEYDGRSEPFIASDTLSEGDYVLVLSDEKRYFRRYIKLEGETQVKKHPDLAVVGTVFLTIGGAILALSR